ncbi:uncharacterized protein DUF4905 [Mucilaginibacter oryzae]|uniref:Uncharacterized protein DUF4905 n=1 Tax=Mucilaginibacter oryzae TaxID=468058 RepID=A0A316HUS7_9SPHI|nr:DUF4905 domain-containing protein [Mucilaginibacter oryzae]PWK78662.1 uncharacterized protein DUF4905 [Mucilaginibacter oryzae]
MNRLFPFIYKNYHAPIWRMEIDDSTQTLFLEIRDHANKQVSFSAISLKTGEVYFENLTTPERWLTGIEAVYNGVLLLHNYQSETGPVHKGLTAIEAASALNLWSNFTLAFDQLTVNGPVVYNSQLQPKRLNLIDIKTGGIVRPYEPVLDTPLYNLIVSPEILAAGQVDSKYLPLQPHANMVHYISYNSFRIVSLHTLLQEQLTQHLYIFDQSGSVLYHDLLNAAITKLQPEAFVLHNNQLIYLKDRLAVIVLNL